MLSINPRDYKYIPGFPTSNVELQMVLKGYILYALIFCRKMKFSRLLKFSFVMICQNVLSSERGSYQSEILLVEVMVAADFEPIKLSVTYTVGFRLQGKTEKKLKKR